MQRDDAYLLDILIAARKALSRHSERNGAQRSGVEESLSVARDSSTPFDKLRASSFGRSE
jgi:hypothetical protein